MPPRQAARLPILLLILLLAAIEPALHCWIAWFPPQGAVATGIHSGDSAHHILCMRAIHAEFHSPFALDTPASIQNFCVPFFLLYALLGEAGRLLGISEFLFLGILNGLGGIVLLTGAYAFLRAVSPRYANRAFCIFACTGGLGGAAFFLALVLGWQHEPGFEQAFLKLAIYDLIEGQNLSPTLIMPRLYYSLPLGMCFFSLAWLARPANSRNKIALAGAVSCVALASFINPRLGPMVIAAVLLYAMCSRKAGLPLLYAVAAAIGASLGFGVMSFHPVYLENVAHVTQSNLWLLSFVAATFWCWAAAPSGLRAALRSLPITLKIGGYMLLGYLGVYTVLYTAHHAYFGTWFSGGEVSAALAVSDWALAGLPLGPLTYFAIRRLRRARSAERTSESASLRLNIELGGVPGWIALWFLLFLAVAVSAAGQGWLLGFSPQRLMVFLGLPLALVTAWGLERYRAVWRKTLLATIMTFGALSVLVGALWFQGPLGHTSGDGPFAYLHYEFIPEQDAALLKSLPAGTVTAPPWNPVSFAEILSLQPGMTVIGGAGALNIGDQPFASLQHDVALLFDRNATPEQVCEVLTRRKIQYVFLPSFCRLSSKQIRHLRAFTSGGEAWKPGTAAVLTVRDDLVSQ